MPIYLTRTTNFKTRVEAFTRRSLDNQASSKVSELSCLVLSPTPLMNIVRYGNMSSELIGRLNGTAKNYSDSRIVGVLKRFDGNSPFESPTLCLEMKSGGEVLNALGMFEVASSKQGVYCGQPTVDHFTTIAGLGIDFYQTVPAGNVNIAGYVAFVNAWRGVRAFMAVGAGGSLEGGPVGVYITGQLAKKYTAIEGIDAVVDEKTGELVKEGRPGREGGGTVALDSPHLKLVSGRSIAYEGILVIDVSDEDIDFQGLLFPYFKEMLEPDVDFAYGVFASLYSSCLEDDENLAAEAIQVQRRGFRYLANSHAGRIIQHVYLGIKLAIAAGATLVLLRDGADYAGFVLRGDDFRVALQNRVFRPVEAKQLQAEVAALDLHNKALGGLYEILLEIPRMDGGVEEIDLPMIKRNPRFIRKLIQDREPEDILLVRKKITEKLEDIKFTQNYWPIDPEHIHRFLEKMVSNASMIDEPMYLHIDVLCNRSSKLFEYLSVFGYQAPSIYHGSKTLSVARPGDEDPNLSIDEKGKRKVPHIPYTIKGIVAAAGDWGTTYRQKGFRFTPSDPKFGGSGFSAAKHRSGYVPNPVFPLFYSRLREWLYTNRDEPQVKKVVKRKSQGEDDNDDQMDDAPPAVKRWKFA